MKYFKKVVGKRIYLSPRSPEDTEIFTKWLNDFEVTDYISKSPKIITFEGEKEFLGRQSRNSYDFSIVNLKDDNIIGTISLENINNISRAAELGIFIGEKDYLSKGYGAEAIMLVLDYGFNYLNLNSIRLQVLEFNQRAMKCYNKCGFIENGRIRKIEYLNGKYYDAILMDILREEFNGEYIMNKNI